MIDESHDRLKKQAEISTRAKDARKIEEVLQMVARKTLQEHARAGRKIPIWRDNQVVWIVPEIDEEPGD